MIVSCPSCAARNTIPDQGMGAGAMSITCRQCGQRWQEIEATDIVDIQDRAVPRVIDHDDAPEHEARRLAAIAREAHAGFAARQSAKQRSLRNWAIFGLFLVTPIAICAVYPQPIVAAAPVTIRAYDALGYDVNIYGLELRRIERQHAIINGTRVLSIKGEVVNVADDLKKIPWLRFALTETGGGELYTWTLDTASRPLRPGESTSFVTRVAAPPELAQNLQIRFAKADEIGSTATP